MSSYHKTNGLQQNGFNGRKSDAVGKHFMRNGFNKLFKKHKSAATSSHEDTRLPVDNYRSAFFKLLNENQTILVIGETGSGKTTQIPQWCLDYCIRRTRNSSVACTQPRRIAAMSVATRVAKEMKTKLGQEVGYSVRFENCSSEKTRLKYLTDGMLLREAMLDGNLSNYGVIVLDEAHERTLQTEILFGVIKRALMSRNDNQHSANNLTPLKVIVMSATINVKLFKRYFNSPILQIEGRQHPVQDLFTEIPQSDLLTSTLICTFQIHRTSEEGDILVFCSGQDEIQSLLTLTKKVLKQAPDNLKNLVPLPLYASLPAVNQMRVFDSNPAPQTNGFSNSDGNSNHTKPSFTRKVIFATNVAETSITIPNIKYVIDTGKVKCRTYCPKTGLESLKVTTISKAQAKQRSGRAGRVAPGTCYRLYTNDDYAQMSDYLPPEIKRCNLDGVMLQMISIGINDLQTFEFLEKPDESRIKAALANLLNLKAIKPCQKQDIENHIAQRDNPSTSGFNNKSSARSLNVAPSDDDSLLRLNYELTSVGKKLCTFPLDPSMSRILLAANELDCLDEAITVVALLSVESIFYIPPNKSSQAEAMLQKFYSNEGDIIMLLKVFRAFKRTIRLNRTGIRIWCMEHFIHVKNLKTARMIRKQLLDLCKSLGMSLTSCGQDTSLLRRALTYGLFNNVATMWDGKYRNKSIDNIHIHPSSCLFKSRPDCVLYVEIVETNKCYMRNCTLIDINWIRDVSATNMKLASSQ